MLVFKNIAKHPTISAVTGMGGHRFLVPQYEVAALTSHGAENYRNNPKHPGLPRRYAPRNDELSNRGNVRCLNIDLHRIPVQLHQLPARGSLTLAHQFAHEFGSLQHTLVAQMHRQ